MKHVPLSLGSALLVACTCVVAAQEKPKAAQKAAPPKAPASKSAPKKIDGKSDAKPDVKPAAKPAAAQPAAPASPKRSPEDEAVAQPVQALVKAYGQRDAKAFAAVFTAEGEYIDEAGVVYHGRPAIEAEFDRFLKANPDTTIQVQLESTRGVAPGIIAADGATQFTQTKDHSAISGRCSLICAKEGNKWLIASLRETAAAAAHASHHEELQQLEWMIGEWIDEGASSHVHFSCRWDDGGNFLHRDFEVHTAGGKTITGTQRIGFDPLNGHLKSWAFDSGGGYAEGYWQRDGESWILNSSGVTADGRMASGSSIFTRVNPNRMSFHSVDRVVGGERIPDLVEVIIVRKPPGPTAKAK
jgi:uncharacterized protein (TIGR02246 family)